MFGWIAGAQVNIAGQWKGTLTQNSGGYTPVYQFELFLYQQGQVVKGRSYVQVEDIYAEMEIVGELKSDHFLYLQELRIVNSTIRERMEWCLKNFRLFLKHQGTEYRLEGFWEGAASHSECIPGKIFLKRITPQA